MILYGPWYKGADQSRIIDVLSTSLALKEAGGGGEAKNEKINLGSDSVGSRRVALYFSCRNMILQHLYETCTLFMVIPVVGICAPFTRSESSWNSLAILLFSFKLFKIRPVMSCTADQD